MNLAELKSIATGYAKKALKTSEGKDPSPESVKKIVSELVYKFAPILKEDL